MNGRVNERQLEVLRWVADGCPEGKWPEGDFSYKISAAALNSRGLVKIKGRARTWSATITETGTHYLGHGTYPPSRTPTVPIAATARVRHMQPAKLDLGKGTSSTLTDAKALIQKLQESGSITVTDPEESIRAQYRRLLHACRVHHLVPAGHELRFTGRNAGDIVVMLSTGSPAETSDWDRIRTTARKITTNLDVLRTTLETSSILRNMSEALQLRGIDLVIGLADQLRKHELKLGANVKLKTPKLFIQTDTRRRNLMLTEIMDEVPHVLTDTEQRELRRSPWKQFPKFDSVPSGRLHLTVERDGSHEVRIDRNSSRYERNGDSWSDEKRKPLERQIDEIARAIKAGVVDDADAIEREKQRRAEAHEAHEREEAAQRQAWEEIRKRARAKALLELRERTFTRAFQAWQGAQELRAFANQLETEATKQNLLTQRPQLQEWLQWARTRADEMDPIANLEHLDDDVFDAEPSADDLRPYMEGWNPSAPHKDYSTQYDRREHQSANVQKPKPWHPGMKGQPSWWRH